LNLAATTSNANKQTDVVRAALNGTDKI